MSDSNRIVVKGGVVRWQSSDNVPFDDMLERFVAEGKITSKERAISNRVRERESAEALQKYFDRNRGRKLSDEERFEMRAAFGAGAQVTNIITGDTYHV